MPDGPANQICPVEVTEQGVATGTPDGVRQVTLGGFAAVRHQDRVLLVRQGYGPGLWGFPGGAVETGEDIGAATRREVLEETGINVRIAGLLAVWERPDLVFFNFLAVPMSLALTLQEDEIAEGGWLSADEIAALGSCFETHRSLALRLLSVEPPLVLPQRVVQNPAGTAVSIWAET